MLAWLRFTRVPAPTATINPGVAMPSDCCDVSAAGEVVSVLSPGTSRQLLAAFRAWSVKVEKSELPVLTKSGLAGRYKSGWTIISNAPQST
jgi:hypothetical protein